MKKSDFLKIATLMFASGLILLSACSKESEDSTSLTGNPDSRTLLKSGQNGAAIYIVVLNNDFEAAGELKGIRDYDLRKEKMTGYLNRYLNGKGVNPDQIEQVYTTVYMGFSAKLSGPQVERLQQDPGVKSVEPDQAFTLGKPVPPPPPPPTPQPPQVIPWNITRVGGPADGTGKTAWVVDTGIDLDHPDLNVNKDLSRNFVPLPKRTKVDTNKGDDLYGHGTACAGQIAAINNGIGTVGVAAGAWVVAVRVFDENGYTNISWIIAGMDYVVATAAPGDVANLSWGGYASSVSSGIDNAVLAMGKKGIKVAIAAGNNGSLCNFSPGTINGPNIYTVAAFQEGDTWASWSNYGQPPVDYCAPGVNCYTTYKGGTYISGGGTSASAPHVAGLLLLGDIITDGYVICPGDGQPYPIAHR